MPATARYYVSVTLFIAALVAAGWWSSHHDTYRLHHHAKRPSVAQQHRQSRRVPPVSLTVPLARPCPISPFVDSRDLYNLDNLSQGRTFTVATLGLPAIADTAAALADLLRGALGRPELRLRGMHVSEHAAYADILLVSTEILLSSPPSTRECNEELAIVTAARRHAVVLSVGDSLSALDSADGLLYTDTALRIGNAESSRHSRNDRILVTNRDRLLALLGAAPICGMRTAALAPARYRGGRGDSWCAAARRAILASWLHALHRGDSRSTGHAAFATYGTAPSFDDAVKRILRGAAAAGDFNTTFGFTQRDVDPVFAMENRAILSASRGGGYWLWKPHVLLVVARDHLAHGDVLFYSDAGNRFVGPPTQYLRWAGEFGGLTFLMDQLMDTWTKGIVFTSLDMPLDEFGALPQATATAIVLRRDPFSLFLLTQWEWYCTDADLLTDGSTDLVEFPNAPFFRGHRHDQSIWSLLVRKYGVQLVRPTDETFEGTPSVLARTNRSR